MKDKASYILIISLGVIVIGLIILCGVLWNRPNNELLKYKEEQTKENVRIIDSIIDSKDEIIYSLNLEKDSIIKEAESKNNKADKIKTIIIHDKKKMNEEINSIDTLNVPDGVRLFNSIVDRYSPSE